MRTNIKAGSRILFLFCLLTDVGQAQSTTARVEGTVVDQSSAMIRGAAVVVKNAETGINKLVLTDDEGRYRLSNLQRGKYQFVVEMPGFKKEIMSGIVLQGGKAIILNFTLRVDTYSPLVLHKDIWNQLSEAADPLPEDSERH